MLSMTMLARRPLLRAISLVYAVLQLVLPGAVSMTFDFER